MKSDDDVKQIVSQLEEKLDVDILSIEHLLKSSNNTYVVKLAEQTFILKIARLGLRDVSPLWYSMENIYGLDVSKKYNQQRTVSKLLSSYADFTIADPKIFEIEINNIIYPVSWGPRIAGVKWDPDEFPKTKSINYELGRFIAKKNSKTYSYFGTLETKMGAVEDFVSVFAQNIGSNIDTFWDKSPALHEKLKKILKKLDGNNFHESTLIMPDISGNQFIFEENLENIAGLVDLDTFVIGPKELELAVLEMCVTDMKSFTHGYEEYLEFPDISIWRDLIDLGLYSENP